jgi:hypothetical protein
VQEPSAHFLSLSHDDFLQASFEQDILSFPPQQSFLKCEQAEIERRAARVRYERTFMDISLKRVNDIAFNDYNSNAVTSEIRILQAANALN